MGFGDKLKGLKDQAQQAVAENKDKIQGAVQVVGDAANTKTHGKYATKIMKVGEKVESGVDKFAGSEDGAPQEDASEAPIADEPSSPVTPSAADTPASGFPEFE
jgi:MT0933-like antitoxin protein